MARERRSFGSATVDATPGAPVDIAPAAGELRISGVPVSRAAACQRVREVVAAAGHTPVSGFSLADLEQLAATEQVPLRAFLEELAQAGLELVSEAPFELLRDPRLAIEEVNIAGLALARLTIQTLPSADVARALSRRSRRSSTTSASSMPSRRFRAPSTQRFLQPVTTM